MTIPEIAALIKASGKSNNAIEKELGIGQGVLSKVLKGLRELPEKYEEPLRKLGEPVVLNQVKLDVEKELILGPDNRDNPLINAARGRDESGINEDEIIDWDEFTRPDLKRPDKDLFDLLP